MIKILVVDDHEIFRKGLVLVLNRIPEIVVVGEASNGSICIDMMLTLDPDIVLMDIQMPVMDGIETAGYLHQHYPKLKIVALSMFGEEDYLQKMIEAGVSGFLLKNIERHELAIALNQIHQGNAYYSSELLPYLTSKFKKETEIDISAHFSRREKEILKEIAKGKSNQEIADTLFISKRTVDGHKTNLIQKTGSKNVLGLLIYALKNGLVEIH